MCEHHGQIIGLKKKEHTYKKIVRKLITGEALSREEKDFLKKQGVV